MSSVSGFFWLLAIVLLFVFFFFFFFNDTATTEIYTLSLHDALPISPRPRTCRRSIIWAMCRGTRSEEHTSELQSHHDLVCRLLLEKKKKNIKKNIKKKKKKKKHKKTQKKHKQ